LWSIPKKGFPASVPKVQHTENAFLVDTTLPKRLNSLIFNKNREPDSMCVPGIAGI